MRDEIIALTPSRKEWQEMPPPDEGAGPDGETSPGIGRRRFLSAGGALAAGAGALTLGRPRQGSAAVTLTAPPAPRALRPGYPADPRDATLPMGFARLCDGSPAYIQLV